MNWPSESTVRTDPHPIMQPPLPPHSHLVPKPLPSDLLTPAPTHQGGVPDAEHDREEGREVLAEVPQVDGPTVVPVPAATESPRDLSHAFPGGDPGGSGSHSGGGGSEPKMTGRMTLRTAGCRVQGLLNRP